MKPAVIRFLMLGGLVWANAETTVQSHGDGLSPNDSGKVGSFTPGICDRKFPQELKEDFPIFLTGQDHDLRPVLFWEMGHFNYAKYASSNETMRQLGYAYLEKIWCRIRDLHSTLEDAEDGVTIVANAAGFSMKLLLSIEVTKMNIFFAHLAEKYSNSVASTVMINTNFVSETWLNLVRPIAGRFVGTIEIAGNRREKYMALLRSKMDDSVIPPWIKAGTGRQDFKRVQLW